MHQIGTPDVIEHPWVATTFNDRIIPAQQSVLVVCNAHQSGNYLDSVCEFLGLAVEHAAVGADLRAKLAVLRPMAVIADLDGEAQDGFHVMKLVADYDRSLPVLLLTDNDPALLGAVDAVQEVWGLTRVATTAATSGIGALVDFICHASRDAGRARLIRV